MSNAVLCVARLDIVVIVVWVQKMPKGKSSRRRLWSQMEKKKTEKEEKRIFSACKNLICNAVDL